MGLDTTHDCWHGAYFDADELAEQIANAEIVDLTSVPPDRKGSR